MANPFSKLVSIAKLLTKNGRAEKAAEDAIDHQNNLMRSEISSSLHKNDPHMSPADAARETEKTFAERIRTAKEAGQKVTEKLSDLTMGRVDRAKLDERIRALSETARNNGLIDPHLTRQVQLSPAAIEKVLVQGGKVTPQEMLSLEKDFVTRFEARTAKEAKDAVKSQKAIAAAGQPSLTSRTLDILKWPLAVGGTVLGVTGLVKIGDHVLFEGKMQDTAVTLVDSARTSTAMRNAHAQQELLAAKVRNCNVQFASYGEVSDTCIKPKISEEFSNLRQVFQDQTNEPSRLYVQKLAEGLQTAFEKSKGDPAKFAVEADAARKSSVKAIEELVTKDPTFKGKASVPNFTAIDGEVRRVMGWNPG